MARTIRQQKPEGGSPRHFPSKRARRSEVRSDRQAARLMLREYAR